MTIFKIVAAFSILLTLATGIVLSGQREDSQKWLDDFDHLKRELTHGYANLQWAAEDKSINLPALSKATEERLRKTASARRARGIIKDFLGAFSDPHLKAEASPPPIEDLSGGDAWTGPAANASAKKALKALGYRKAKYDLGVNFRAVRGFRSVSEDGSPFPAGIVSLPDGRVLGVLRIEYFGEDRYHAVAEEVWARFRSVIQTDNRNSACARQFRLLVRAALPVELAAHLGTALDEHERLLGSIMNGCDASPLWEARGAPLDRTRLAVNPQGGLDESDFDPDVVKSLNSRETLFAAIRHPDFVGVYDGPVFVIIDGGSASATEQFATLLQFNGAASIVGEGSYGAGCRYTNGGIKVHLENTGLRVWMPDCLRSRADGFDLVFVAWYLALSARADPAGYRHPSACAR